MQKEPGSPVYSEHSFVIWRVPVRVAAESEGAVPLWSAVDVAKVDGAVGDTVDCWLSQPAMKAVAMNAVATMRLRRIMGTSPGCGERASDVVWKRHTQHRARSRDVRASRHDGRCRSRREKQFAEVHPTTPETKNLPCRGRSRDRGARERAARARRRAMFALFALRP